MHPLHEAFYLEGAFLFRRGKAHVPETRAPCQRKLCLTSTSVAPMLEALHALSLREDCFIVKLDPKPGSHGMVRGRGFLTSDEAVAEAWVEFKNTEQILCTIQDDDFTRRFR